MREHNTSNDSESDANNIEEEEYKEQVAEYEVKLKAYHIQQEKYVKYLDAYRTEIGKVIEKSNDMFEKQLIYVAAGTLAASVLIVEKFLPDIRNDFNYLLLSWAFCGAAIVLNMVSHYFNMVVLPNTIKELHSAEGTGFNPDNANKRRSITKYLNGFTLAIYFAGLGFFVTYVVNNMENMNKPKVTHPSNDGTKGYEINTTVPPKPNPPAPPPSKPSSTK